MNTCVLWSIFTFLAIAIKDIDGLQCFNCRGVTNYDPDECENPEEGRTIVQECNRNEACEKKIHHIDRFHHVVSRGCSANCNNREYIYTDDFQVHCCTDANLCNTSSKVLSSKNIILWTTTLTLIFTYCNVKNLLLEYM